ncbi:MAG TPA: S-methyl-5-thioribose-1-phosphate isomerase, partial [Spirochaetia bacterium]|nr:S-methyl-5-thioribose-1-phosphate isomerase [Spirochaetia bacterium]
MYDFPLTIEWRSGRICFLDQTLLPERELMLEISSLEALIEAIKMLRIRGAPAIG